MKTYAEMDKDERAALLKRLAEVVEAALPVDAHFAVLIGASLSTKAVFVSNIWRDDLVTDLRAVATMIENDEVEEC